MSACLARHFMLPTPPRQWQHRDDFLDRQPCPPRQPPDRRSKNVWPNCRSSLASPCVSPGSVARARQPDDDILHRLHDRVRFRRLHERPALRPFHIADDPRDLQTAQSLAQPAPTDLKFDCQFALCRQFVPGLERACRQLLADLLAYHLECAPRLDRDETGLSGRGRCHELRSEWNVQAIAAAAKGAMTGPKAIVNRLDGTICVERTFQWLQMSIHQMLRS